MKTIDNLRKLIAALEAEQIRDEEIVSVSACPDTLTIHLRPSAWMERGFQTGQGRKLEHGWWHPEAVKRNGISFVTCGEPAAFGIEEKVA